MKPITITVAAGLLLALPWAYGSDSYDAPPPAAIDKARYSPYPEQDFPNRVFFGDTHLHTSYSTDAGMIGNTLGPEEAYRCRLPTWSAPWRCSGSSSGPITSWYDLSKNGLKTQRQANVPFCLVFRDPFRCGYLRLANSCG